MGTCKYTFCLCCVRIGVVALCEERVEYLKYLVFVFDFSVLALRGPRELLLALELSQSHGRC